MKGSALKNTRVAALLAALSLVHLTSACGDPPAARPTPARPDAQAKPGPTAVATATPAAPDLLGPKPDLAQPRPFTPPAPVVFEAPNGIKVWLLERHTLPIVSVALALPWGSAADPASEAGLAHITADMLDEGAGRRDALQISSAINDLGASLGLGVRSDGSFASLTVLKKNFTPAFAILSDVIVRPRFDTKEWARVSELWQNGLKKRGDDPAQVARVASGAALYGPGSPYGHPTDGTLESAQKIKIGDVKAFYKSAWRPDRAVLVVVGDITRDEILQAINREMKDWKAPKEPPPPEVTQASAAGWKRPRLVLVDRPGAPQSVIMVVREGVSASDRRAPLLGLINTALGGSFTSRLNQNLREEHGWSYGAASAFTESRSPGAFVARASVVTEATGPALKEMLGELAKMADSGLTQDEFAKVRAQDRADLVQTYETTGGTAQRMAVLALLGLPATFDAAATEARQKATLARLAELSAAVDPKTATVVVVGPRDKVVPQLDALKLGEPQLWDVEGRPVQAKK